MNAAIPAIFAAALLAMAGAFFGVVIARGIWADDLRHAKSIDEIRSRTERSLSGRIDAQERLIQIYKGRLGEK